MVTAVIVAGGAGERFGAAGGKQLRVICGKPLVAWSVLAFERCPLIDAVVLVTHPDRVAEYGSAVVDAEAGGKLTAVIAGGNTRHESVVAGLGAVAAGTDLVAIHDGARPLVSADAVSRSIETLRADPALAGVVVGHPVFDTLKEVDGGAVVSTVDRHRLWVAQTPQVFRLDVLRSAYLSAEDTGFSGTDDASFVEHVGGRVAMIEGPRENIKVTVPDDVALVEAVMTAREGCGG